MSYVVHRRGIHAALFGTTPDEADVEMELRPDDVIGDRAVALFPEGVSEVPTREAEAFMQAVAELAPHDPPPPAGGPPDESVEYGEGYRAAFFDANDRAVRREFATYAKVWDTVDGQSRLRIITLPVGDTRVPVGDIG